MKKEVEQILAKLLHNNDIHIIKIIKSFECTCCNCKNEIDQSLFSHNGPFIQIYGSIRRTLQNDDIETGEHYICDDCTYKYDLDSYVYFKDWL